MSRKFKVAAVQMNCVLHDTSHNLAVAEKMIREAAAADAVIIVVPELFDTGYRVEEKDQELASAIPGRTTDYIQKICKELNVFVIASTMEKADKGEIYDTAFVCGPDGVVGTYRKNALWDKENGRFNKGNGQYQVYDIGICKVGLQICYEVGFPEGARILSLQGADIIAYPSAFGSARLYAWDLASRARALENGNYVIACNRSGQEKGETFFGGNSRIVGPQGNIIADAQDEFQVIVAEVDLDEIRKQRNTIPYYRDLRCQVFAKYYELAETNSEEIQRQRVKAEGSV